MPPGVTSPVMTRARTDGRVNFIAACGQGHLPVMDFDRTELEQRLADGTLEFHCVTCGTDRPATPTEMGNLRRRLADGTL
jgi:hypothetical protein